MANLRQQLSRAEAELAAQTPHSSEPAACTSERCVALRGLAGRLLAALKVYEHQSRLDGRLGELSRTFVAQALRGDPVPPRD